MSKVADILANPADFGFTFQTEKVSKKDIEMDGAQILVIQDAQLFETHFPGRILAFCDGQSCRVWSQGLNRTALWADRNTSAEDLQQLHVMGLLGSRSGGPRVRVVTERVFVGLDGNEYATLEEAQAATA